MTKKSRMRKAKETAVRKNEQFISDREMGRFTLDYLRKTRFPGMRDEDIEAQCKAFTPEDWAKLRDEAFAARVGQVVGGTASIRPNVTIVKEPEPGRWNFGRVKHDPQPTDADRILGPLIVDDKS